MAGIGSKEVLAPAGLCMLPAGLASGGGIVVTALEGGFAEDWFVELPLDEFVLDEVLSKINDY